MHAVRARRTVWPPFLCFALVLGLGACGGRAGKSGHTDGAPADATASDGGQSDGGQSDGGQSDGGQTDGGQSDGGQTDGGQSDGGQTDAAVPDAAVPDAAVPDASVPDASVPDAAVPDASVPDAAAPDAAVPDAAVDAEVTCGNGVLDTGELCDFGISSGAGSCPTGCDDTDPCTTDTLTGTAAACDAACSNDPVTACATGDSCCPSGCDAITDGECAAVCGDGVLEPGEVCDFGISSGAGSCPTACDDPDPCTTDTLTGTAATCDAACSNDPVIACTAGDSCCPTGCDATSDGDCTAVCGNGVLEPGELCDTGISAGAGSCPTGCDDGDACTNDVLMGSGCQTDCDHTQVPTLPTGGFDQTPTTWDVPDEPNLANGYYLTHVESYSDDYGWTMVDMNGDGLPDLVDTIDHLGWYDVWGLGSDAHWRVYLNTGAGFASAVTTWDVPDEPNLANGYYLTHVENYSDDYGWTLKDMNGDGLPDIVDTIDHLGWYDVWGLGSDAHWRVYLNTGTGFATAVTTWDVPDEPNLANGYYLTHVENYSDDYGWTTVDMNGDGLPDLVDTIDHLGWYDVWGLATDAHWRVYLNTGSGFATSYTTWDVPDEPNLANGYYLTHVENYSDDYGWTLKDMNGDGLPDIVDTIDHLGWYDVWGLATDAHWRVYLNTGSGFATSYTTWDVPDEPNLANGYYLTHVENYSDDYGWTTVDMNGDGLPDLVDTIDHLGWYDVWGLGCDAHWRVYLNTGTGFATTPLSWPVPDESNLANGYYLTHVENYSDDYGWTLVDMNGDGFPDLVDTIDHLGWYDVWGLATDAHWRVHLGQLPF